MQTLTKEDLDKVVGHNFKHVRKWLNLTQQKYADWLEVGRPLIGAIEEGRSSPTKYLVYKLSCCSGISLEEILTTKLSLTKEEKPVLKKRPALRIKLTDASNPNPQ